MTVSCRFLEEPKELLELLQKSPELAHSDSQGGCSGV